MFRQKKSKAGAKRRQCDGCLAKQRRDARVHEELLA
eukprot:SAG25_NODE_6945_length_516_cov_1.460432_1_plen_35_part_10